MDEIKVKLYDVTDIQAYQEYEKEREENEQQRISNENQRISSEQLRESQEGIRQSNETIRQSQEQSRQSAETLRVQGEEKRASAEILRDNAETLREKNEETRKANEASRTSAEQLRVTAEENRVKAESSRANAETTRVNQESTRQTNENSRISAEQTRLNQEAERQEYYQEIQTKVNNGDFNGRGIVNTEKVSSVAGVDTYNINYTDGQNPDTFTVTNGTGSGDMETDVYDTNKNGIVDNSEKLNNQTPDYYLDYNNFTNKPSIPATTGELTNNSDFTTKSYVDNTFETKTNANQSYATKAEATYSVENTSTINMNLISNELSAVLNDNSVSEQKLDATLISKINGKLDSANALSFSTEEEMEEDTNETSTTTTTTNNETE